MLVIAGDEEAEGGNGPALRAPLPAGMRSAAMAGLATCLTDATWYEEAQRWALRALRLVRGGRGWEQAQSTVAGLGSQLGRELDNLKESGKELYADGTRRRGEGGDRREVGRGGSGWVQSPLCLRGTR